MTVEGYQYAIDNPADALAMQAIMAVMNKGKGGKLGTKGQGKGGGKIVTSLREKENPMATKPRAIKP
jgi:hypothetical protein